MKYCSIEHQRLDWPNHKPFCKQYKETLKKYRDAKANADSVGAIRPIRPSATPIHDLVLESRDMDIITFAENNPRIDINATNISKMTPFMLACSLGDTKCVFALLQVGADIEKGDYDEGITPLIFASWHGHVGIVRLLLYKGAEINKTNKFGATALSFACTHSRVEIVRLLCKY